MGPMPTYEYRCTSCVNRFDVFQRIDVEPLRTCERCGGELRKVFHPAGIVFRGSGFYATDSRAKTKTSSGSEDGSKPAPKKDESKKKEPAASSDKKPAPSGEGAS